MSRTKSTAWGVFKASVEERAVRQKGCVNFYRYACFSASRWNPQVGASILTHISQLLEGSSQIYSPASFWPNSISLKILLRLPYKLLTVAFWFENILIWNYGLKNVLPNMEHNTPNIAWLILASFTLDPVHLLPQSKIAVVFCFCFCFSRLFAHLSLWHADTLRSQWSGSLGSLPPDTCSADFLNLNPTCMYIWSIRVQCPRFFKF